MILLIVVAFLENTNFHIEDLTYVYEIWGLHVPFWRALLNPSMDSYPINFWNQTHIWPNLQVNSLEKS